MRKCQMQVCHVVVSACEQEEDKESEVCTASSFKCCAACKQDRADESDAAREKFFVPESCGT